MKKEKFDIGPIVKPRGLKGVVKVNLHTDKFFHFKDLSSVEIDNKQYDVESSQFEGNFAYFKFKNFDTIEDAETLRGRHIFVKRSQVNIDKDRHFIADLLGSKVFINDENIGVLKKILQNGSADVYSVELQNGKSVLFPALKTLVVEIDLEKEKIVLDEKIYNQVAVFQD